MCSYLLLMCPFLGPTNSLSDQLNETTNTKILRLELENQRLRNQIVPSNENSEKVVENTSRVSALERENQRLSVKVKTLQQNKCVEERNFIQLEKVRF